ncbi:MAG: DUF1801 domain-containing protein [Gammaproteobacteria bacterium]|nr:DUF1801 domain-containing protein [Gammaproteobacteria bacterium]
MSDLKTKPTRKSPTKLIEAISHPIRRQDCQQLLEMMSKATSEKPVIWGENIVGFGRYHYHQRNGQKGMWPLTGFSSRKQAISIYIMPGFSDYQEKLTRLGKHTHSVSCLYITRLSNVDLDILAEMIQDSVEVMRERYTSRQVR